MTISATATKREQRKQATAARLTAVTRRLTAERGFNGFTIDEVCDEVDISRRTFFNYFPTKEDAVLGANPDESLEQFEADYEARGSRGWGVVIDDLVDLVIVHFDAMDVDAAGHAELMRAIEREPRLLLKFIGVSRERDRQAAALVARREGVALDDARVESSVAALSALMRSTGERFLHPTNSREFPDILRGNLAAMRAVFGGASSESSHPSH